MKETCITCRQVIKNTLHLNVQTATSMYFQGFYGHKKTTAKGAILYFNREKQPYLKHKSSIIKKIVCTSGRYGAEYSFIWVASEFASC
jgi:hypothetical protein